MMSKTFVIKAKYVNGPVELTFGQYSNKRTAMRLLDAMTGEPLCVATTNLVDEPLAPDEVIIKGWSENEGIPEGLMAAGIISPVLRTVPAGYTHASVHVLLVNKGEQDK